MRAYLRCLGLIIVLLTLAICLAYAADSVVLSKCIVRGAYVSLVTADLGDPRVTIDIGLPAKGISHSEPFRSFVRRSGPIAAVTGTYFDTRTLIPTGSIVAGGRTVYESNIGTAVCFTPDNHVKFIDAKKGQYCDLSGSQCALRTGPRLLANGQCALNPKREGFRHAGLFGARTRMAMGVTATNKLLLAYVGTPVTFSKLAGVMKALGAVDAVCLDGGTSSAMYYRGRVVQHPGRQLTNVVEVRQRSVPLILATGPATRTSYRQPLPGNVDLHRVPPVDRRPALTGEHVAVLAEPMKLRLAKGVHAFFPTYRA